MVRGKGWKGWKRRGGDDGLKKTTRGRRGEERKEKLMKGKRNEKEVEGDGQQGVRNSRGKKEGEKERQMDGKEVWAEGRYDEKKEIQQKDVQDNDGEF